MNYYHHMLESQARQQEALREYKRQALVKEAHNYGKHRLHLKISLRFRLPNRKPQQPPCPTCPEFA
jgi:hypothetical protein